MKKIIILVLFFSSVCHSKGSWNITSSTSTEGSVSWRADKVDGGSWDDYQWSDDYIKKSCESAHELVEYTLKTNKENYAKMGLVNSGHDSGNWMKLMITKDCDEFIPTAKPSHIYDGSRGLAPEFILIY